jgi:hypothetical protein
VTAPTAPSDVTAQGHGTFTVAVPGTGRVSKKVCLSGTAANKCQTVTVPAVQPVDLVVNYSGNAEATPPTFTPAACPGGIAVTVAGLTPGATLSATVNGKQVTGTVPERSPHQAVSLCDA